jgi:hypothetical protein
VRILLAVALALTFTGPMGPGGRLAALQSPRLTVSAPADDRATVEGPRITTHGVLDDSKLEQFINSGFPARLHYRIDLWARRQFFDNRVTGAEWIVIVEFDQLQRTYTVRRQVGERLVPSGTYSSFVEMQAAIAAPFEAPVRAPRNGQRMYYHLVLDIQKVSLSDLDELEAWLRGELKPATRGQRNPGTALARGFQTLMLRMLGGENPRYEARSETFTPR